MWVADLQNGNYRNPVLYADYSDPDAIRVGEDYFMIASSFSNSPALPVLHSKDLVNWKVINYCLKHVPEFRYNNPLHGCGVWAPSIRYHEGTYYVCFPMPDEGIYMTTTKDPWGEWSKPVNIRPGAGWIDPCPFWDDDGKAYHIYSSEDNLTLQIAELSDDYLSHTGKYIRIFPGGHNEAPAIFKKDGIYWMITSGCTGWEPNKARLLTATSILGEWKQLPNPCVGENADKTFGGQSTYVLPLQGTEKQFIFMADSWRPESLADSRYIWLPVRFDEKGIPFIEWVDRWKPN